MKPETIRKFPNLDLPDLEPPQLEPPLEAPVELASLTVPVQDYSRLCQPIRLLWRQIDRF
jgi:hypothetical protein